MRIVAWLAGVGTLLTATGYMLVSLYRWEWNRALFFGLIMLLAEVGLATGLVLRRLAQMGPRGQPDDPAIRAILRQARPPASDRFAWLEESTRRTNVFVSFLVGGGVLLSAGAWIIDRVAARTSTRAGEQRLAQELQPISYPKGGLLLDDITVLAQEVPGADDTQIRKLLRRATPTP